MTLPKVEDRLQELATSHGKTYDDIVWRPALKAVMEAENNGEPDREAALKAVEALHAASMPAPKTTEGGPGTPLKDAALENDLLDKVKQLHAAK